jgi:mono/diheme cytochrome c family protein
MRKLVMPVMIVAAGAFMAGGVFAQTQAEKIDAGKKVFTAQKCSTCHSVAGVGSKVSPLDGVGSKLTAQEIRAWITDPDPLTAKLKTKPKVKMKKYVLKDPDLDALVAYLQSLTK